MQSSVSWYSLDSVVVKTCVGDYEADLDGKSPLLALGWKSEGFVGLHWRGRPSSFICGVVLAWRPVFPPRAPGGPGLLVVPTGVSQPDLRGSPGAELTWRLGSRHLLRNTGKQVKVKVGNPAPCRPQPLAGALSRHCLAFSPFVVTT